MASTKLIRPMLGILPRKKLGKRYGYGESVFAESRFGGAGLFGWIAGFGQSIFAGSHFGDDDELTGIYQKRSYFGHTYFIRERFYITKNPRLPAQQVHRSKFAAAVAAWQILTAGEKAVYNKNAIGRHMSGYNLFLRQYIL